MTTVAAIKQLSKQSSSTSITVLGMIQLLNDAGIKNIPMGYDSWGSFSYSQTLYVVENIGYIVRRKHDSKNASVNILNTKDCLRTECGKQLRENEIKAFKALGLALK
ncbi:hypothetical protein GO003_024200 [Methylicorpusculum oleiharenae]|uniref:hypothetical protein n=1 Tax=Methylicorpusculum oleiharenae TaxID=1338687 RepID=UPI0013567D28|nr:hypothetical protein [Methylicorpusculum oleiharenae]MCD2453487.1 hypothetical protein [Methylicorpusculum oleiharenae]